MSKKNDLQEGLNDLEEILYEAIEKAEALYSISSDYRCFGGQLKSYLLGTLKAFVENDNQPGSIAALQGMLDDDEDGYDDEEEDKE